MTFLAQHDNDNSEFSEDGESDVEGQGQKHRVRVVPHISVCRRANAHLPEVVPLKNAPGPPVVQSKRLPMENSCAVYEMEGVPLLTGRW